jgi:phage anti-repressor protein
MTDLTFSLETAQELFESTEEYPVNFDFAWQWLGYSTKQMAFKKLKNHFVENVDYVCGVVFNHPIVNSTQQDFGGRPSNNYSLTVDCLKDLGMMAGTEKGKQIRAYFRECEKLAKQFVKNHKDLAIAAQLSNKMVADYKKLTELSTFYANEFVEKLGVKQTQTPVDQTPDLNASLVANRLGLAFNKQIKAFEAIQDATSPEAFDELKKAYYQLAVEHSELLKVKTAPPKVEYVDKIHTQYIDNPQQVIEIGKLKTEIMQLKMEIERLKSQTATDSTELDDDILMYPKKLKRKNNLLNPYG